MGQNILHLEIIVSPSKMKTVPYFATAKFETNSCTSWQNLKRSHILQPQNLRPFCHVMTKFETVPYFAAAKFETVLTCQIKIWNGPIFSSRKIWDRFTNSKIKSHVTTKFETVPYFAAAKFETVSPCHVKYWNGPIFCSHKIWDRFTTSEQNLNRSHILWLQL